MVLHNCIEAMLIGKTFELQETALHLACAGDHVKVVKLLLSRGASVTARTVNNQTPLDIAIENRAQLSAAAILQSDK